VARHEAGPDRVLFLSLRQTIQRLPVWIRINAWGVALSLPIVSWPAAQAGLYQAVRDSLLDPFDQHLNIRASFLKGFRQQFARSLAIALINVGVWVGGILAIIFWTTRPEYALRFFAIVAISVLFFWWLSQVFIYPVLIENPVASLLEIYRRTFLLVLSRPAHAVVFGLLNVTFGLIELLLLGPSLLFIPTLSALVSIQGMWAITGDVIPDLFDPVEYADGKTKKPITNKQKNKNRESQ
jgi:uncharacterized membrane protein YesL